jgi:hypothetical protein
MDTIEQNNREQLARLGDMSANQMTKREKIASEVMANLADARAIGDDSDIDRMADLSVRMADALLRRLAKR